MLEPILRLGPPDRGKIKAKHMKALVMTSHWSFDDTKADVAPFARNKIPARLKNNGLFSIPERTEGFLVEQKGSSGWALFFRDGAWYDVVPLPMNRVRIGKTWRSLKDQVAALSTSNPVLRSWAYDAQPTRLKDFVRSFWFCLRSQQDLLLQCGLRVEAGNAMFGNSFQDNIKSIIDGFTAPAMAALRDGVNITTLSQLPKVSAQWPAAGCKVIYIRLYTHQNNGNIDACAIYAGQSTQVQTRQRSHDNTTSQNSPHYNVARRSSPQHRHMIPLIVWGPQAANSISASVFDMAEQTVVAMFDSYHSMMRQSPAANEYFAARTLYNNQYSAINAASHQVRLKTGWSYSAPSGCNAASPMFGIRNKITVYCYPERFPVPGQRSKTVFRVARVFSKQKNDPGAESTWHLECELRFTGPDGALGRFNFGIPTSVVQHFQIPNLAKAYLVFELMNDDQPHEVPYAGCPTVGPFKDFGAASRLGIHVEWFNSASGNWVKIPLQMKAPRSPFAQAVRDSNMLKAINSWRKATDVMQFLQGIDYQGNTHGLRRSLYQRSAVQVFTVNHLEQSIGWVSLARQSRPAPELATFEYNAALMREHWKESWTQVNIKEMPPHDSDFWRFNTDDDKVARSTSAMRCDLCHYMGSVQSGLKCERDPRYPDRYVCKSCSLLNRPCTFTARSKALVLWGEGPPNLPSSGHARLARYPTGRHRFLAFHETLTLEQQTQGQPIASPFEGHGGLELIGDFGDEDAESRGAVVADDYEHLED